MNNHLDRPIMCRGIRGATTVEENTAQSILAGTRELLMALIEANALKQEDIASAYFTTTEDLNAEYPALAARQLGWHDVALLCGHEMNVPHGLKMCVRVMIHWNTTRQIDEVQHIYLKGAVNLRPDRKIETNNQSAETANQNEKERE